MPSDALILKHGSEPVKSSPKIANRLTRRALLTNPTYEALTSVMADLETAQDALAHAANDLAHLARDTENDAPKAAVHFALDMRDACAQVLDTYKALGFWWWLERVKLERRAQIIAGLTSDESEVA